MAQAEQRAASNAQQTPETLNKSNPYPANTDARNAIGRIDSRGRASGPLGAVLDLITEEPRS
jgi:hypothetical protein